VNFNGTFLSREELIHVDEQMDMFSVTGAHECQI